MKRISRLLVFVFFVVFSVCGFADNPCAAIEKDMIKAEVDAERASARQDFLKIAELFENAVVKAPLCSDAFYNLGLAYEKIGDIDTSNFQNLDLYGDNTKFFRQAKSALEKYLSLNPNAQDETQVKKQIFKLEYKSESIDKEIKNRQWLLNTIAGKWKANCVTPDRTKLKLDYYFTVMGDSVNFTYYYPGFSWIQGCHLDLKFDFDNKRFPASCDGEKYNSWIYVVSDDKMEERDNGSGKKCDFSISCRGPNCYPR